MFGEQFNLFRKAEKMTRTIDYNLACTIAEGVRIGYLMALEDIGKHKRCVSERQAVAKYGSGLLKKWRIDGLVDCIKTSDAENGKITYDRVQLQIAWASTIEGRTKKRTKTNYKKI